MGKNEAQMNKGFTLLEVLIVIAIMILMSAIAIPSFRDYTDKLRLTGEIDKLMAITREAQNSAVNVVSTSGSFQGVYGVYVEKNFLSGDKIYFYTDTDISDGDYMYSGAGTCGVLGDECQKRLLFDNNVSIERMYYVDNSGSEIEINFVNLAFKRPLPDPIFYADGSEIITDDFETIHVELKLPNGQNGELAVGASGYMYVQI
jgi:prepilin-type N-terminal cleavage/methylation domain-containing protein